MNLDNLITKLTKNKDQKPNKLVQLTQQQIRTLIFNARKIIYQQPVFIQLVTPIKICGDIHGQYYDLLRIFNKCSYPPNSNYLFLGDYVDRGKQSIQTICLLLSYKIKFPQNFFLLRGNHQCSNINRMYGFYDQCIRRYNIKLWKAFSDLFNCFPIAALIQDKVLCMHGGLSPQLFNLNQLKNIIRPIQVPESGLLCDILWSDPDPQRLGWNQNQRGVSYVFSQDIVSNFIEKHQLDLIVRAHQVVQEGYEFFSQKKLITIFSAPNYCGQFDNSAGILNINQNMQCSLKILQPQSQKSKQNLNNTILKQMK